MMKNIQNFWLGNVQFQDNWKNYHNYRTINDKIEGRFNQLKWEIKKIGIKLQKIGKKVQ